MVWVSGTATTKGATMNRTATIAATHLRADDTTYAHDSRVKIAR